MPEDIGALV